MRCPFFDATGALVRVVDVKSPLPDRYELPAKREPLTYADRTEATAVAVVMTRYARHALVEHEGQRRTFFAYCEREPVWVELVETVRLAESGEIDRYASGW